MIKWILIGLLVFTSILIAFVLCKASKDADTYFEYLETFNKGEHDEQD